MRVREIIRLVPNLESEHAGTYIDPISMKPRQFDFRCVIWRKEQSLQFALECKNLSKDFPVVVCGTKRSSEDAFHEIIESRNGLFVKPNVAVYDGPYSITRKVANAAIYREGEFVGKSIIKLKPKSGQSGGYTTEADTDIYERWTQALSSSYDLCKAATNYAQARGDVHFFTATIPVVVLSNESLWILNYDTDGVVRTEPFQTDHCRFFVGRRLKLTGWEATEMFSLSHIHFCTLSGLKSWMDSINDDDSWSQWLPPESLSEWKTRIDA
jgi:hypothetical protein